MSEKASKKQILIWEIICVCGIILFGGPLHSLFGQSGYWRPVALIAAVNESIWEHLKMFFWPGLLMAGIQYLRMGKRIPHFWSGKLVALIVTPVLSAMTYIAYMAIERASGDFSPSDLVTIGSSMVCVCIGQAACYRVLTAESVPPTITRFTSMGYLLMILAFSSFTYFPPRLYLFEQHHHYEPIGQYGIDADPQLGRHPWEK